MLRGWAYLAGLGLARSAPVRVPDAGDVAVGLGRLRSCSHSTRAVVVVVVVVVGFWVAITLPWLGPSVGNRQGGRRRRHRRRGWWWWKKRWWEE